VPTLLSLMAVCVAHATNARPRTWTTPDGSQCIAAQVATAAGLDMRACWTATKDSYLAPVPIALSVEAVREGAGAWAAGQIVGSKKEVMDGGCLAASRQNGLASFDPSRFEDDISPALCRP
jgi:hypothetical protein